jgi:hypothetical protein
MRETNRKLREIDDKLAVVQQVRADIERLEQFLTTQRAAVAGEARGVLAGVEVSREEIDGQVRKARDILSKWSPR